MLSTVERAVQVMSAMSRYPDGLSLGELAREVGSNKQAVFRITKTLAAYDLVASDAKTGKLHLGAGLLRLADAIAPQFDLRKIAVPVLSQLRTQTGETACLHVRFGKGRVCIAQVESRHELRWIAELGKPLPLTGAPGKVFQAFPRESRRSRSREGKESGLEIVRKLGYAVARNETVAGVSSISAPVFDQSRSVVAAVTVMGPSARFGTDLRTHASAVSKAAKKISDLLRRP
jgi:DNA-binding IclR family transcriptional regulator